MSVAHSDEDVGTEPLVLIFDGHCGVCSRFVAWTQARDTSGRIRFVPCQQGSTRPSGVERGDCEGEAIAVGPGSTIYRGAGAINAVLRELPPPWPSIAGLSNARIVGALERMGYRWFARNRQLFSRWGLQPECAKPSVTCD